MRLIDADALNKKLCETTIFIKDGEVFQRMINDAPTIEPDGDTISRSRAIKDVSEWATDILHPDRLIKEDAIYILESLPSAETPTVSEKHQLSEETPTNTPTDLISRQDAINAVENTDCELTTKDWEELTGALKSLPSAEQVTGKLKNPCDSLLTDDSGVRKEQKSKLDLISRQDAIEVFTTDGTAMERAGVNMITVAFAKQTAVDLLEQLPSAPDSRQRGEWVYGIDDETGEKDCYPWTCSVCNKKYPWQPNFCPNCGTRMCKGGEEE